MNTLSATENLAAGVWQSGLAQVLGGLVVVAVLIGAFMFGIRVRNRESAPPKTEEHPHRPDDGGLPGEATEYRQGAEMPRTDAEHRLMPYQLNHSGTETSPQPPDEEKRKWGGISSGGFGSGGTGHGD
ncbi:DUF6479 family protein [Streptomyces sp. S1]|uniref:DUF6479 family protein n=1 Tax=unclassified Streptomyces TaxID=2593676 RepID=UPI000EF81673|nr:DUF6479 family protein [Streptomyces sp. S1]